MRIQQGWLTSAKKCLSPNYNERPDNSPISLLVIHNISLPPAQFANTYIEDFFSNRLDIQQHPYFNQLQNLQVSAHCLIKRTGAIVQFVNFNARAWHAGRSSFNEVAECNDYSIGVELEGTDTLPYTQSQYTNLAALTNALIQTYPALNQQRITGHSVIAPSRKTDPGPSFNWAYFKALINAPVNTSLG